MTDIATPLLRWGIQSNIRRKQRRQLGMQVLQDISRKELKVMHEKGFLVGSHSVSHNDCSKLNENDFRLELTESQYLIKDITGGVVDCFAFPYGSIYPNFQTSHYGEYNFYFGSKPGSYKGDEKVIARCPLNSKSNLDRSFWVNLLFIFFIEKIISKLC